MKSFLPFTIALLLIIATLTIILVFVVALLTLKYHFFVTIQREYKTFDNQLALINLLFYPYNSSYNVYQILAERKGNNFQNFEEFINQKAKLILQTDCFQLLNESGIILGNRTCKPSKFAGEFYIFKPYEDGLVEKIWVVSE
jgi:hypothetical protein